MADEHERQVRRFAYLGGKNRDTKAAAVHAAGRREYHETAAADLRAAADALEAQILACLGGR